jgi:hypothetical protein
VDNGSAVTSRDIEYSTNAGASWTPILDVATVSNISGLAPLDQVLVRNRANNAEGNGEYSEPTEKRTAAGASFDISTLPLEFYADFMDGTSLYTDAGRTTPVSADGQAVFGVADKSGNGRHATFSNNRFLWSQTLGQVDASTANSVSWLDLNSPVDDTMPGEVELFMVFKTTDARWIGMHNGVDAFCFRAWSSGVTSATSNLVGTPVFSDGLTDVTAEFAAQLHAIFNVGTTKVAAVRGIQTSDFLGGTMRFLNDDTTDAFSGILGKIILTGTLDEEQRADLVTKLSLEVLT